MALSSRLRPLLLAAVAALLLAALAPRRAVRGEQRGRINLETARRIGCNIAGGHKAFHPASPIPVLPEQQPAHFRLRGGGGCFQQNLPIPA